MDLPKWGDLFAIGRDEILSRNGKLTREAVEREGSDINVDVAASAAIGDECIGQLTKVSAGQFIDSAEKQALDRLLYDRYGLLRKSAAPAVGSVNFQIRDASGNPAANPATFTIPSGTPLQTATGEQFVTTVDEVYLIGSIGPVVVAVRSVLAGSDQQAAPNTISSLTGQVTGSPASPLVLTVNNPLATSGAADEESDPDFRSRGRAFFSTARRGTLAAIEQGALAVQGVLSATAFEVIDLMGRPARFVSLIIGDQYTDALAQLTSVPPAYATQSQVLAQNVFAALDDVRAAGIYVQVIVGQVVLQPVQLNLSFVAGIEDVDLVALEARSTVVMYTNALPPGIKWTRSGAQASLATVPGLAITGNEIASPAGDVIPKPLQIIRTTLALCTAIAIQAGRTLVTTTNPDAFATA